MLATSVTHFKSRAIGTLALLFPLLAVGAEPNRVRCISLPKMPAACDGVSTTLDAQEFLRRWPKDTGVRVTVQQIFPKHAKHPLVVEAGMIEVFQYVSEGKTTGLRPLFTITMAFDTDNLADGPSPTAGANLMGMQLAAKLNELMRSGAVDK